MKLLCFIFFILLSLRSGGMNASSTNDVQQQELILGHFTLVAVIVISVIAVILITFTIMACYIDFSNLSKGIENLEVCDESVEGFEPHRPRKKFEGFLSAEKVPLKEQTSRSVEESSHEDAVRMADLAAEATQLSKLTARPPRLDAQAKQARIIEAIYQASGREVPEIYRTKTRTAERIEVPPIVIQQTVEGIAEKETHEPGSPVTSPTHFAALDPKSNLSTRDRPESKHLDLKTPPTQSTQISPARGIAPTQPSSPQEAADEPATGVPSGELVAELTRTLSTQNATQPSQSTLTSHTQAASMASVSASTQRAHPGEETPKMPEHGPPPK